MALSIDDNDDIKKNHNYNYNHINVQKHHPYVNGTVRQSKYKQNFTLHYDNDNNYMLQLQFQLHSTN